MREQHRKRALSTAIGSHLYLTGREEQVERISKLQHDPVGPVTPHPVLPSWGLWGS